MADETKPESLEETPATDTAEEDKLKCDVNIADSGPWKKKIALTIPREEIDRQLNKKYREMLRTAEVPGFRKGRAPRRLIEKRYGEEITSQTKMEMLVQAFGQVEEQQKLDVLSEPNIKPDEIVLPETGDFKFEYEIEIRPEFELPKLEGIRVEKPVFEVTEERTNQAIEDLRARMGKMEDVDGAAQANDMLEADVTLKVDGVEEPQTETNMSVRVGLASIMGVWVEDLEKELVGVKSGDTKTIKTKIAEAHHKEEYRNKDAQFTLSVKKVRRLVLAELNQDFFGRFGVTDEAELRRGVAEDLESRADREIRDMMKQQVYNYLNENTKFELPEMVTQRHASRLLARRYYDLMQRGVAPERIQESLEQIKSSSQEQAARDLKTQFVMDKVATELNVEVTEEELNNTIAQIAAAYRRRPERLREELQTEGRIDDLRYQLRDEQAIDKLLEMAEIVDAPAEKPAEPAGEVKKSKKVKDKAAAEADKAEETKPQAPAEDEEKGKKNRKDVKRKPPKAEE